MNPNFVFTRRVRGKTRTETFPNPTALRKTQQEVAEFHRFQKLSEELVGLNEAICQLRPVEQQRGGWTDQEKKRNAEASTMRTVTHATQHYNVLENLRYRTPDS